MIILPQQQLVFVAIPRTGSMAMSHWLEAAFRPGAGYNYPVEELHNWHATLDEAAEFCDFPLFRMWSFCVVRNPYDRLVSRCARFDHMFKADPRKSLFDALTMEEPGRMLMSQVPFTQDVSQVYRYEQLPAAVKDLRERFDIPATVEFGKENESERGKYRMYYDKELRALFADRYAEDLKTLDYRF